MYMYDMHMYVRDLLFSAIVHIVVVYDYRLHEIGVREAKDVAVEKLLV